MGKAVIAIHGGAGAISRAQMTPEREREYVAALSTIVESGQKMLAAGASALDAVTEAHIQGAFDKLAQGRTTLIIAHRLSTIRNAQRILVLTENGIEESGTHAELLAKGGIYQKLCEMSNLS